MSVHDLNHDEAMYALAIERADYRRALQFAVRGSRRTGTETWRFRVQECFKRRRRSA